MYLELSAMYLMERHRTFEAGHRRQLREVVLRGAQLDVGGSEAHSL